MRCLLLITVLGVMACESDDGAQSLLPADWEASLVELRGCRQSPDHDLEYVRLLSDAASEADYERCTAPEGACTTPFPEGALFVKPQYSDAACRTLVRVSLALKDLDFAAAGGWRWQELDEARHVTQDGALRRCAGCHATCEGSFDHRCYMAP